MRTNKNGASIVRFYQMMLNASLIILGLVLSFYLLRELYAILVISYIMLAPRQHKAEEAKEIIE